jgi:hypothetical protein
VIYLITYGIGVLFITFVGIAYNEAKITDEEKRIDKNYQTVNYALRWPLIAILLVFVAPIWAFAMLAKWFGRNYL